MSEERETSRLDEIEIMLVHQEQQIEELDKVIQIQWKEIDALKAQLKMANAKIDELEIASPNADQKPPHY